MQHWDSSRATRSRDYPMWTTVEFYALLIAVSREGSMTRIAPASFAGLLGFGALMATGQSLSAQSKGAVCGTDHLIQVFGTAGAR